MRAGSHYRWWRVCYMIIQEINGTWLALSGNNDLKGVTRSHHQPHQLPGEHNHSRRLCPYSADTS